MERTREQDSVCTGDNSGKEAATTEGKSASLYIFLWRIRTVGGRDRDRQLTQPGSKQYVVGSRSCGFDQSRHGDGERGSAETGRQKGAMVVLLLAGRREGSDNFLRRLV